MTKTHSLIKRIAYFVAMLGIVALPLLGATHASAAQITARKVIIGSSLPSASTTYNFTFTAPTATTIQSIEFKACTTASGACASPPAGFSEASSTLSSTTGLGSGGTWIVNTALPGSLRVSNGSNTGSPSAGATVNFGAVVNPSALNSTFYLRMTTYSAVGFTGAIDTGVVATSTAGAITVNATVDETLTFTLAAATVTLTNPTTSATGTGTSTMTAATNASSGYSITVAGSTLGGPTSITAMTGATGNASSVNSKQFGINLKANTTPSVGTNVTGSGSGVPTAASGYDVADFFKFVSGNTIAGATAPTNSNTYTVSYVANIDGSTPAGAYTTTITYVATPNF